MRRVPLGFKGILQVDNYRICNLERSRGADDGWKLVACFAPVGRRFYELQVNESSQLAALTIRTMARLWEIEAEILRRG
jgi:transposase